MSSRTANEFEAELKEIDERFSIVENPNRPGLSNIFFMGKNYDLPVISTHLIKDVVDPTHRYEFPNGMMARMWSSVEIIDRLKQFLIDFKGGEYEAYGDEG